MSPLLGTVDGWRATARSIRWSPLLVAPAVSSVALVVMHVLADGPPGRMSQVGEAALAFTAVTVAFVADDAALDAAPATPTEAPARLAVRAALMAPVSLLGWLLVLSVYGWLTPGPVTAGGLDRALGGLGLASAALALAALAGRLRWVVSPGAAGVAAMAGLGAALVVSPAAWLEALPPVEAVWPVTVLLALVTVAVATREPAG